MALLDDIQDVADLVTEVRDELSEIAAENRQIANDIGALADPLQSVQVSMASMLDEDGIDPEFEEDTRSAIVAAAQDLANMVTVLVDNRRARHSRRGKGDNGDKGGKGGKGGKGD